MVYQFLSLCTVTPEQQYKFQELQTHMQKLHYDFQQLTKIGAIVSSLNEEYEVQLL